MGKQYELKDVLKHRPKIAGAEGRFCIELTDPITGKVLERVKEHNRIFEDMLFGCVTSSSGYLYDWQYNISNAWLLLTDSENEITPDTTFLFGNLIGYGQPNSAGYGSRRGAYVADAQQLAIADTEKVHWKFQYEFTASQAVGKIATIGLSYQYANGYIITPAYRFRIMNPIGDFSSINDGEFVWSLNTGGIINIQKRRLIDGNDGPIQTFTPVNLAYEGQNLSRSLGYNPITKRFYIYTYKTSSPQERILQEYSDGTFSNLIQTRTLAINWSSTYHFYIYGNYMIAPATNYISVFNYVTGGDEIRIYPDSRYINNNSEWGFALYNPTFSVNHIPVGRYLYLLGTTPSSSPPMGAIFDMETFEFVSYYTSSRSSGGGSYAPLIYPIGNRLLLVKPDSNSRYLGINGVLTAKKLDTPVVKPNNRGMIVSYELDVYW